jgi:hypothetical protein
MREFFTRYAVGAGAGVAAAVLFLAALRAGAPALFLANLAPLPLMIAALGWGLLPGLTGVLTAGIIVGAANLDVAPGYMLVIAGPAWALAAFACAPAFYAKRPDPPLARPSPGPGAIALAAAVLFIAVGAAMLTLMLFASGGYVGAVGELVEEIGKARDANPAFRAMLPDMSDQSLAEMMVQVAPIALAVSGALMQLANLYLAARSVQLSGRLGRAWRDIPTGFRLPRWLGLPTAAGIAAGLLAPSPFDGYGLIVACAFGALYILEALAALHALSRFSPARPFMLGALYFACFAAFLWVLPALAVLGLAESFADLRGRAARTLRPRPKT